MEDNTNLNNNDDFLEMIQNIMMKLKIQDSSNIHELKEKIDKLIYKEKKYDNKFAEVWKENEFLKCSLENKSNIENE